MFDTTINSKPNNLLESIAKWLVILLPVCMVVGRSVMDTFFVLSAFLFLIHCVKNNEWHWFKPAWVKLALVCWLYLICLSIFNIDTANNLDRGFFFGRFIFGALAIQWVVSRDGRAAELLFVSLCVCVFFTVLDVFYQYYTGVDLLGRNTVGVRLTGPFSDLRAGAMLLWMSFPVIFWFAANRIIEAKPFTSFLISALVITACVAAIFVSGERMAFLMTLFGLLLSVILLPVKKPGLIKISLLVIAFVLLLAATNQKIFERQFLSSKAVITNFYNTEYGQLWRNGINVGLMNPLFGVGPRNFRNVCSDLPLLDIGDYHKRQQCNIHPHNTYIEWFSETGLIGFCFFVALVFLWIQTLFKARRVDKSNLMLASLTVCIIIRLWPIQTTGSFFSNTSALPFWIMLGWALAMADGAMKKRGLPESSA